MIFHTPRVPPARRSLPASRSAFNTRSTVALEIGSSVANCLTVRRELRAMAFITNVLLSALSSRFVLSSSQTPSAVRPPGRLIASIVPVRRSHLSSVASAKEDGVGGSSLCGIAILSTPPFLLNRRGLFPSYILITTSLSAPLLRRWRQHIAGIDIQCSGIRCIER